MRVTAARDPSCPVAEMHASSDSPAASHLSGVTRACQQVEREEALGGLGCSLLLRCQITPAFVLGELHASLRS